MLEKLNKLTKIKIKIIFQLVFLSWEDLHVLYVSVRHLGIVINLSVDIDRNFMS